VPHVKDKACNDLSSVDEHHKSTAVQKMQRPLCSAFPTKLGQLQAIKYNCINLGFKYIKCKICKLMNHVLYTNYKALQNT